MNRNKSNPKHRERNGEVHARKMGALVERSLKIRDRKKLERIERKK